MILRWETPHWRFLWNRGGVTCHMLLLTLMPLCLVNPLGPLAKASFSTNNAKRVFQELGYANSPSPMSVPVLLLHVACMPFPWQPPVACTQQAA
ncbi:hypothetical protein V8C86DRAFT_2815635 [Haematococcus lacustris]